MLYTHLLKAELENRLGEFRSFQENSVREAAHYARGLRELGRLSPELLNESLNQSGLTIDQIPAFPIESHDVKDGLIIGFEPTWASHEESRRWASDNLLNRTTFAADGSQLMPGRDLTTPVAAVQVAWFENPHTQDGAYVKDARFEVISPARLFGADGSINAEKIVTFERTRIEIEKLCDFMFARKGWRARNERMPLAFFDGSLSYLVSFPSTSVELQANYSAIVLRLISVSEETGVPVAGFVDHSYARELVKMVDAFNNEPDSARRFPYNAQVLKTEADGHSPMLARWGDRTVLFSFGGHNATQGDAGESSGLSFCYLQTTSDSLPARLDLPSWVLAEGLVNEILEVVRAECVVGLGYPYALETADEAAVIGVRDREIFLSALREFSFKHNMGLRVTQKPGSKRRRR